MPTAQRILVVYGVVSLMGGFALGVALSRARAHAPTASHHLVTAHLSALMQGTMHLALVVALELSTMSEVVEAVAAVMLVVGSAMFVAGTVANWRQGVGDHFAARSLGWKLLAASSVGHFGGLSIMSTGVLLAL